MTKRSTNGRTTTLPALREGFTSDLALPADLVDAAKAFTRAARAPRTRKAYRRAWEGFQAWCTKNRRQALPASPETVALWLTAMATGKGLPQALARSSINQALSAVSVAHRTAKQPFDRKDARITETLKGICNVKAQTETVRKAKPLMDADLRAVVEGLRGDSAGDVRDAALLALGWAGALRRSEIVGLDWQERGTGAGFVVCDERAVTITLMSSKASQDLAETIVVPRADMPTACRALDAWAAAAALAPGEPIFRSVDQREIIAAKRLTDGSVSRIVKRAVARLARARGNTTADALALASSFSGHSMRAGFATSAAAKDVPSYRIRQQTRHKSVQVLEGYIREGEKLSKNALKGVGF